VRADTGERHAHIEALVLLGAKYATKHTNHNQEECSRNVSDAQYLVYANNSEDTSGKCGKESSYCCPLLPAAARDDVPQTYILETVSGIGPLFP